MTAIDTRLAEIRARVEAATEGPWFAQDRNLDEPWGTTTVYNVFHNGDTPDRDLVAEATYDNAEFIAHSRTDLPTLLAAVETVRELHRPDTVLAVTGDCALEDCDHEELEDCETVEFVYCLACNELAEEADPYYAERGMGPVAWPCPTVRDITDALEVQG